MTISPMALSTKMVPRDGPSFMLWTASPSRCARVLVINSLRCSAFIAGVSAAGTRLSLRGPTVLNLFLHADFVNDRRRREQGQCESGSGLSGRRANDEAEFLERFHEFVRGRDGFRRIDAGARDGGVPEAFTIARRQSGRVNP